MAVQIHPPGRYGIENLAAVLSLKKHAFATPNPDWCRISAFVREWVPQMQVGCAHGLWKRLPVEIIREYFQQRRAVDFFEHGDVSDYAHFAEVFNGAPILNVFCADQNDAVDAQLRATQRGKCEQSVIDRAQRRARRDDYGKSETPH